MSKFGLVVAVVVIGAAAGVWYWAGDRDGEEAGGQQKTPHFVDSTPLHGEVYAARPINITINFNFDVVPGSTITVRSEDGREWQTGEIVIEDVQTALKAALKPGMPDGLYAVNYYACWPDGSCHEGVFSFAIDSAQRAGYVDKRGQAQVRIPMKDLTFQEPQILISPGTTVTWVNEDGVDHFVNTETHPEHTYFPPQNSREIAGGKIFATTFTELGQYNYHCSAHVPEGMLGSIIVAES